MDKNLVLEKLAESLDITPSQYQEAMSRFENLKNYLSNQIESDIYLQGSFRLGTVIRPCVGLNERDFDLDIVCLIKNINRDEKKIKHAIGNILKKSNYAKYLDDEGKRCWTLNYKENENEGFHIDVLPCIAETTEKVVEYRSKYPTIYFQEAISLTHKQDENIYKFRSSNPKGFASWFFGINNNISTFSMPIEKAKTFKANSDYFQNNLRINEAKYVPDEYIRTPLQRVIQILKRHRDSMFADNKEQYKPISIIITVLVAKIADECNGAFTDTAQLVELVMQRLDKYTQLNSAGISSDFLKLGSNERLIEKLSNGTWRILNPADPMENLADRWHEDGGARANCFFEWIKGVKTILQNIATFQKEDEIRGMLNFNFGKATTAKMFSLIEREKANGNARPAINIASPVKPYKVNE